MKHTISVFFCYVIVCALLITVCAADEVLLTPIVSDGYTNVDLGEVISANIHDVNATGGNLNNSEIDTNCKLIESRNQIIQSAFVQDDFITISGSVNGQDFLIEGPFCSISENKNVIVFDAKDRKNNFRVVFCAVEKDIEKSSLYFKTSVNDISKYNVVTKLYLAPIEKSNDYILTEIYGNAFPAISKQAIAALPEEHYLNRFWYAREFKPVSVTSSEEVTRNRAGNVSYGQLVQYTFNHLGMEIKHYLWYWQDCDIRNVTRDQTSSASATLRISEKRTEAPLENDCSSTTSTLSLHNVAIVYLTRPQTAVNQLQATGNVTQNGRIVTSFSFGIGVGINGLDAAASLSFTWQPGYNNMNTDTYHMITTNAPGSNFCREAEAALKSSQSLSSVGNYYTVNWIYSAYTNNTSSANASLAFKYYVDNRLDYSQGYSKTDVRNFTVQIT